HGRARGHRPMKPFATFQRIGAPVASAIATALVFTVGLWIQHTRSGWPFDRPVDTPRVESMAGMEPKPLREPQGGPEPGRETMGASTHNRVPVDSAAAASVAIPL